MATPRFYDHLLAAHFAENRQMAFLSGPRQVGKTTAGRRCADAYVNWDNVNDRERVLAGPQRVADSLGLERLAARKPLVLFDELHKFPRWKEFLKGFFDTYGDRVRIAVTGSSRLDVFRRGGDSLMGRYFHYRMHPFSVAELASPTLPLKPPTANDVLRPPRAIADDDFNALWEHGGFPEPFLRRDARFTRRWRTTRAAQLVREDVREISGVQQLDQLEVMVRSLTDRSAEQLVFGNLAKQVRVSADTVRRWVAALSDLHVGFLVRPWFENVSRSLRKEPKWFVRDWAAVPDVGRRAETFIACHLLKAVDGWNDLGLGAFELGYLRDKEKREVDFVVVRDGEPWFLVEAKHAETALSSFAMRGASPSRSPAEGSALRHFARQLDAPFAFQAAVAADYIEADCFATPGPPLAVPARTLLSQLL